MDGSELPYKYQQTNVYVLFDISKTPSAPIMGSTSDLVACGSPEKAIPRGCQIVVSALVDIYYYVGLLGSRVNGGSLGEWWGCYGKVGDEWVRGWGRSRAMNGAMMGVMNGAMIVSDMAACGLGGKVGVMGTGKISAMNGKGSEAGK